MRNSGLWWGVTLALLPLVAPLALYTRRTALRLPEASGDCKGLVGEHFPGEAFSLVLLGESTVAGVGVATQQQGLSAQLAHALAAQLRRPVCWRAVGENGITAQQSVERLLEPALREPADLVLVVLGVNDTTHLCSRRRWRSAMVVLARTIQAQGARVAFSALPPLEHFSALPWLLRRLLGWRARLLDDDLRVLADRQEAHYCAIDLPFETAYLACDGYHPSAEGYRLWAQSLALQLGRVERSPH